MFVFSSSYHYSEVQRINLNHMVPLGTTWISSNLWSGFLKDWRPVDITKSKIFAFWMQKWWPKILPLLKWHEPNSAPSYFRSEDLKKKRERKNREDYLSAKALFTVTCIWLLRQATMPTTEGMWSQSHPFACIQSEMEGSIYS